MGHRVSVAFRSPGASSDMASFWYNRPPTTRAGAVRGGESTHVPGRARGWGGWWGLQGGSPARHTFMGWDGGTDIVRVLFRH